MTRLSEVATRTALGEDVRLAWGESGQGAPPSTRCAGSSPPN
ncbi:hypothetical protein [Sorangium sp. So ce233]